MTTIRTNSGSGGLTRLFADGHPSQMETKSHSFSDPAPHDVRDAVDEFMSAFEEFKSANDDRLTQLERKLTADVVTEEKVNRLNTALDLQQKTVEGLALSMRRTPLGAKGSLADPATQEHKSAWEAYVRSGHTTTLRPLEAKALSAGTDADGGYLVPSETETMIDRAVSQASPLRAISGVRQIGGSSYRKPFATSGPETGWVGETASRPETDTPVLSELEFPAMEIYAMPAATQSLLDDSAVNIEQWLAEEVQLAFAEQESTAFITGDGTAKPKGFLTYTQVDNSSWTWGKLGVLETGVAGGFPTSDPTDKLIDLIYSVKSGYRANGHFVMNGQTLSQIRKFKDADGNYIWQPSLAPGELSRVLNVPVAEAEDMPSIAADACAIAYGDFKRGYLIVDRVGIRVLRDPYSAKPYVLFYTTKRVGGGVQNFEAIKLLKFSS